MIAIVAVAVVVVLVLVGVITASNLAVIVIGATVVAAVAYFFVILSNRHITGVERKRVYAFIPLFIASAAFWSLYQQQFTVVTIYSDERLDRSLFGREMPVSWVRSTRSSSSCSPACSPRCGRSGARSSRPPR